MDKTAVERLQKLATILQESIKDAESVDKGVKAPRTRLRKALQEVINESKDFRKDILNLGKEAK